MAGKPKSPRTFGDVPSSVRYAADSAFCISAMLPLSGVVSPGIIKDLWTVVPSLVITVFTELTLVLTLAVEYRKSKRTNAANAAEALTKGTWSRCTPPGSNAGASDPAMGRDSRHRSHTNLEVLEAFGVPQTQYTSVKGLIIQFVYEYNPPTP